MSFDQTSIRHFLIEHGKTLTLRKRTAGEYDIPSGTVAHLRTDYSVYGYSMNNSPFELTDNSIVVATRKVILYGKDTDGVVLPAPVINDQVIEGDEVFDILKVNASKSHESIICYTLTCKG